MKNHFRNKCDYIYAHTTPVCGNWNELNKTPFTTPQLIGLLSLVCGPLSSDKEDVCMHFTWSPHALI